MPLTPLLLLLAARATVPAQATETDAASAVVELPVVAEKKWAVCVGAGAYTSDLAPLKYPSADARAFADVLEKGYGFEPSTVGLLTDESGTVNVPTSANILRELDRLLGDRRLDRGDLFVFYFSGHGVGTPKGDYLMPTDVPEADAATRGVPVRSVIERFVKAGLKNVLVVADACRSGQKNPFGRELQALGRQANIAVLLGCAPGQRSYEAPRLGNGVFTHFLVKAMTDRNLTDPRSGALWASAVASKVTEQVKAYTETDHPDDPQVPAAWSEATQDVLIAAYPPATGSAWIGETLRTEGGRLPREAYARFLSTTGRTLQDQARSGEAIQALKTLDGLGLATWRDLGTLAIALNGENRDNEVGSLVARAVREPSPVDISEYVILLGQPGYVGVERFRKALASVADPKAYGFNGVTLLVTVLRGRLRANDAAIARALTPLRSLFSETSAEGRYIAAHIALGERRYDEAISAAEAATPGANAPDRDELRQVRFSAAVGLKDDAKADAVIAEGEADPTATVPWTTTRLERLQARKDPTFVAEVQKYAAKTDYDRRITELLLLLGADAGELLPAAERLQIAHPYSWQAAVNVWLASSAKDGFETVPPIPEAAFKYSPDEADLVRSALNRWDDLLEEARLAEKVTGRKAAALRGQLAGQYLSHWDAIQDSPVALMGLGRMLMRSDQGVRGAAFASGFLWPYARKQSYVRHELMATSLFLALNGADETTAHAAFAALENEGGLSPRNLVRYAMHQALAGDAKEAERAMALWPKLGRGEPDAIARGYFAFTRALLAAKRGDAAEAIRLIDTEKAHDRASGMLGYLAVYESKGRTSLSNELVQYLIAPDGEFTDLQVAATVSALRGYAQPATDDERKIRRALSMLMARYPGHPWTLDLGFDNAEGIAAWTGHTEWGGEFTDGVTTNGAVLILDVDAKGAARGTVELTESKAQMTLKGNVDVRGNLAAEIRAANGQLLFTVTMKLPPTATVAAERETLGTFTATLLKNASSGATLLLDARSATLPSPTQYGGRRD